MKVKKDYRVYPLKGWYGICWKHRATGKWLWRSLGTKDVDRAQELACEFFEKYGTSLLVPTKKHSNAQSPKKHTLLVTKRAIKVQPWNQTYKGKTWQDMSGSDEITKKCNFALYRRGIAAPDLTPTQPAK